MSIKNLFVFILIILFLSGCKNQENTWTPIDKDNTVRVALIGDKEYISDGYSIEATELAINDCYNEFGIKIEPVIYDDETNYNKAVEIANEIANDPSISVVIVKQELDYIDTTAEIFDNAQKPFIITNGIYEHTINQNYKYMLVDCINASLAGKIMGKWVMDKGYKRVVFCHSDTEYEKDELKGFQYTIKDSDVKFVESIVGPYSQEEFDIAYSRWNTLGVDAVCISNYDILNSDIVKMLRKKGSDIAVIGDYVMDSDEDIEKNGQYLDGTAIVGMYINDFNENDLNITNKFKEKYGFEMAEKAIQSYDIIRLIASGISSGITEPFEFIEYMKQDNGFECVSGTLKFDENGCIVPNGNEVIVFKQGSFLQNTK